MPLAVGRRCSRRAAARARRVGRGADHSRSLSLVRRRPNADRGDTSVVSDSSNTREAGADPGAGWIRYFLIPFGSKETNRLITHVESTFEDVTVDSLSSKAKNELERHSPMISQHCRCLTRVNVQRVATTLPVHIAAEPHFPRATASIQSP